MSRFLPVFSILALAACGGTEPVELAPTTTGATFAVSAVANDIACVDAAELPDPAWSYQTPHGARIGVAAVELLRSPSDPNPVRVFSAAPARDTDLVAGDTFVAVDTGSIPEGLYTHMRVRLDWLALTLDATGHPTAGISVPGNLDVDIAISDHDDPEAGPRLQGDYTATFSAFGHEVTQAGSDNLDYPPPYPDAEVDVSNGAYWMTFPTPETPFLIDHSTPTSMDVEVLFCVEDAFGWQEVAATDNADGAFDLSNDSGTTERPEVVFVRRLQMLVND